MEWGTVQLWEVGNCDNKGRGQKVDFWKTTWLSSVQLAYGVCLEDGGLNGGKLHRVRI